MFPQILRDLDAIFDTYGITDPTQKNLFSFTWVSLEQFLVLYMELREENKIDMDTSKEDMRLRFAEKILEMHSSGASSDSEDEPSEESNSVEPEDTLIPIQGIPKLVINGTKIELPYLPDQIDYAGTCQGIRLNHGLYTPCGLKCLPKGNLCKTCQKAKESEKLDGLIDDRQSVSVGSFTSKKTGKKEVRYATYLAKKDLSVAEVNEHLLEFHEGIVQIPQTPSYCVIDGKKSESSIKKNQKKMIVRKFKSTINVGKTAENNENKVIPKEPSPPQGPPPDGNDEPNVQSKKESDEQTSAAKPSMKTHEEKPKEPKDKKISSFFKSASTVSTNSKSGLSSMEKVVEIKDWLDDNEIGIVSNQADAPDDLTHNVMFKRFVAKESNYASKASVEVWLKRCMAGVYNLNTGEDMKQKFLVFIDNL